MKEKILTIIVPIYNAKDYIETCINSIVKELTEQMELILIDDGSTDSSKEVYDKYKDIKEVKIIKQENHGVSYTRNRGIEEATGKFMMFVDIDDYLKSGWSKILLNNIEESDEYIIFSKNILEKKYEKEEILKACLGIGNIELNNTHIMSPFSKIFRTELIKNKNIKFDENIINGEDMLFNFETIIKAKNVKCVNSTIYVYRKNINSATNRFNKKTIESELAFHNKLHEVISTYLSSKWEQYENSVTLNGIYICFLKYALGGANIKINELTNFIEENKEYKEAIKQSKKNKHRKIFFYFLRAKKYRLAILYVKLINYIKKLFYALHKQNIIEEI